MDGTGGGDTWAGFVVVNTQPVKAEMSVATPKSQTKEPIQLDIIIVCRKADGRRVAEALPSTRRWNPPKQRSERLYAAGFDLSRNDRKIVLFGQLLTTITKPADAALFAFHAETAIDSIKGISYHVPTDTTRNYRVRIRGSGSRKI